MNQQTSNLITTTINAFNGESVAVSPLDGISLIDNWTSVLRNDNQASNPVMSGLNELKAELQNGNPDGGRIQQILQELVDQARQAADSADTDEKTRLNSLTDALNGFAKQLGGSANMVDAKEQQAPMTSTVEGNSATGSTNVSTVEAATNEDLSTRNASAMGMDDMTGAEGAQRQDGGSYGSGYGTGSEGDDYSTNSGTQRSGISGGSAESGSGSSGGRSQY
ncbi:hypothetical protein [Spirosoma montaniterrae]|uniref:Uncharacterized protein n=1 Tax=Spirosoma montaniterrae TaxID=1178516 RepID=A0A1P9X0B9_9BACT|nr:hypothetical protein [Spirosoma montaniterrae]AQG81048.1 hypothetical protein AWR27_18015 [Spirosoma montaniterrae]